MRDSEEVADLNMLEEGACSLQAAWRLSAMREKVAQQTADTEVQFSCVDTLGTRLVLEGDPPIPSRLLPSSTTATVSFEVDCMGPLPQEPPRIIMAQDQEAQRKKNKQSTFVHALPARSIRGHTEYAKKHRGRTDTLDSSRPSGRSTWRSVPSAQSSARPPSSVGAPGPQDLEDSPDSATHKPNQFGGRAMEIVECGPTMSATMKPGLSTVFSEATSQPPDDVGPDEPAGNVALREIGVPDLYLQSSIPRDLDEGSVASRMIDF